MFQKWKILPRTSTSKQFAHNMLHKPIHPSNWLCCHSCQSCQPIPPLHSCHYHTKQCISINGKASSITLEWENVANASFHMMQKRTINQKQTENESWQRPKHAWKCFGTCSHLVKQCQCQPTHITQFVHLIIPFSFTFPTYLTRWMEEKCSNNLFDTWVLGFLIIFHVNLCS